MLKRTFFPTLAAAVLLSTVAFAQVAAQPQDGYQSAPSGDSRRGPGAMQQRLRQLHDRLAITPAQRPQWDAVVATLRDNAQALRASPAGRALRTGQMNAPEELRAAADLERQRAEAMQRMIGPVDTLYAALSPEQRQVADQEITRMMHRGPGQRRG